MNTTNNNNKRWSENLNAANIELDRTYTLNQFAILISDRYCVARSTIVQIFHAYQIPRVIEKIGIEKTTRYITPATTNYFLRIIEKRLSRGVPIHLAFNDIGKTK